MGEQPDPIKQLPPQHEDIVRSTWSQLLGAEGNVQNLAVDLVKSLVKSQLGGNAGDTEASAPPPPAGESQEATNGGMESNRGGGEGGNNNDLFSQLGGLAGQFLGTRRDGGGNAGGGDLMGQLGGLAGQFLGGGRGQGGQSGDGQGPHSEGTASGGGGGNLMDTLGGVASLARQFGGGSGGGGGGGGNIMQLIGSLGGMAALAQGLQDPGKLLSFFMKTPVAQDAGNPDNSSRDIYKIIKGIIFNLLGSKLPEEDFNQNSENKSAWKGYLGIIAKALRGLAT